MPSRLNKPVLVGNRCSLYIPFDKDGGVRPKTARCRPRFCSQVGQQRYDRCCHRRQGGQTTRREVSFCLTLEQEIENIQNTILVSEEALLEVLCFDFWVENVHEHLIDLLEDWAPPLLQDYAWSIAHDSSVTFYT